MEIILNENYKLQSSNLSVDLKQYVGKDKDDRDIWKPISYYSTFTGALKDFARRQIRECTSIREIVELEKQINNTIQDSGDKFPWDDYAKNQK